MSNSFQGSATAASEQPIEPLHDEIWRNIEAEAREVARSESALTSMMGRYVLPYRSFADGLANLIAHGIVDDLLPAAFVRGVVERIVGEDTDISRFAAIDLAAIVERDPAVNGYLHPFLFYNGFRILQTHRVAHRLWQNGKRDTSLALQSAISRTLSADIHPAAEFGHGILIDHGIGVVIGETAVLGNDISIMHEVTLGGSGVSSERRHPQVKDGVLLSSGAKLFGDIEIGEAAKVGAGSVVLNSVSPRTTVVGVPAKPVGGRHDEIPALTMNHEFPEST
jgi:serine O-acetyltransferase